MTENADGAAPEPAKTASKKKPAKGKPAKAKPKGPVHKKVLSEEQMTIRHGGSDAYSDQRDALQAALVSAIIGKNKTLELLTMEQASWLMGGLPLPSICLAYLIGQDAFPLGRSITLSGEFGSNKSTFAVEMVNWLMQFYGTGWLFDAEGKFNPDLVYTQIPADLIKAWELVKCQNQQNWQAGVTSLFEFYKKAHAKTEFRFPVGAIVDSISALKPAEDMEKAKDERGGAGARSHPSIPLLNADWFQIIAPTLASGPFVLIAVQHSRPEEVQGMPGVTKQVLKGGRSVGYNKSLAFHLTAKKHPTRPHGRGGADITIQCTKNALGPTHRAITVPLRWYREPIPGAEVDETTGVSKTQQKFVWGWYEADIVLFLMMRGMEGMKGAASEITRIIDLNKVTKQRKIHSRALGIPEDAPVSYAEAGMKLNTERRDLLPRIYEVLGIERRQILSLGGSINKLWEGKVTIPPIPAMHPYRLNCAVDSVGQDETEEAE